MGGWGGCKSNKLLQLQCFSCARVLLFLLQISVIVAALIHLTWTLESAQQDALADSAQSKHTLTSHGQFSCPPHHKSPKLDFTGVIPNVVFFHLLDGQNVSFLDDAGPPLLWIALLWGGHADLQPSLYADDE